MLSVYGLVSDTTAYQKSLGVNINLNWGLVMFVFGSLMLAMALRDRKQS